MDTAVALIIFNRPHTSERVLLEIAKVKPAKLFVIADGPRPDRPGEAEKCAAARAVVERVDWDCEVFKNYSDVNLGCAWRVATGITWVLEHVEEAIILEDDCVPHPTFFGFCEELLEKYRGDERVMMISGTNHVGQRPTPYSYYFRRLLGIWGWATWRRAWRHFDMRIKLWPELRETDWLLNVLGDPGAVQYWHRTFDKAYADDGHVHTWDFQWVFACWAQNGLAAAPRNNLVCNIGFDKDATHTKSVNDVRANIPATEMVFPLNHPPYMMWDRGADELRHEQIFRQERGQPDLYRRLRRKFSAAIPDPLRKQILRLKAQD